MAEQRHQTHRFQQLTGCDIVKRGTLYVKHPPSFLPAAFSIQPWKKRYVVLRDTWYCSPCVVTSLDIYDSDSEPSSLVDCHGDATSSSSSSTTPWSLIAGRHEPYSLDLRRLTDVGFHLESRRFQFAFYVERCDDRPLLFAAESDLEMRCWVAALRMLADKARLGVKMSPDSRRSVSTATSSRRRTLPSVDERVALSLDQRRRNLSEPQLHAVPSASRPRAAAPLHASLRRKLTAPSDVSRPHPSPTSAMSNLSEVDAESLVQSHSLGGAAAAAAADGDDDRHPLRRMFSASVLSSLLAGGRRRAFSKSRRKDSGFSESFDDADTTSTHVDGQDSPPGATSPPPPTPPPRPPPRRTSSTSPPMPRPPPPPPPPPGVTGELDDVEPCPPTPPPRPPHTLPTFSSTGVQ